MRSNSSGGVPAAERRRHRRFAEDISVLFVEDQGSGEFHSGWLSDLSVDGLTLHARRAFPTGSRLYLGILLRDRDEPLVALGGVQHCTRAEGGDVALGLQFLSVSLEQRQAIARLRAYLHERYGADAGGARPTEALVRQVTDETWWQ